MQQRCYCFWYLKDSAVWLIGKEIKIWDPFWGKWGCFRLLLVFRQQGKITGGQPETGEQISGHAVVTSGPTAGSPACEVFTVVPMISASLPTDSVFKVQRAAGIIRRWKRLNGLGKVTAVTRLDLKAERIDTISTSGIKAGWYLHCINPKSHSLCFLYWARKSFPSLCS